jgi:hypothetical protein
MVYFRLHTTGLRPKKKRRPSKIGRFKRPGQLSRMAARPVQGIFCKDESNRKTIVGEIVEKIGG